MKIAVEFYLKKFDWTISFNASLDKQHLFIYYGCFLIRINNWFCYVECIWRAWATIFLVKLRERDKQKHPKKRMFWSPNEFQWSTIIHWKQIQFLCASLDMHGKKNLFRSKYWFLIWSLIFMLIFLIFRLLFSVWKRKPKQTHPVVIGALFFNLYEFDFYSIAVEYFGGAANRWP